VNTADDGGVRQKALLLRTGIWDK